MSKIKKLLEVFKGCSKEEVLIEIERLKQYIDKVAIVQSISEFPELILEHNSKLSDTEQIINISKNIEKDINKLSKLGVEVETKIVDKTKWLNSIVSELQHTIQK